MTMSPGTDFRATMSFQERAFCASAALEPAGLPAVVAATRWTGVVDASALSAAWGAALQPLAPQAGSAPALPLIDLSQVAGERLEDQTRRSQLQDGVVADWVRRHEVGAVSVWGPLLGAVAYRLDGATVLVMLALEHSAVDAMTVRLLAGDALRALRPDADVVLHSEGAPSYEQFVGWQDGLDPAAAAVIWADQVPPGAAALPAPGVAPGDPADALHVTTLLSSALAAAVRERGAEALSADVVAATVAALGGAGASPGIVATSREGRPPVYARTLGCFVEAVPLVVGAAASSVALRDGLAGQLVRLQDVELPLDGCRGPLRADGRVPVVSQVYAAVDRTPTAVGAAPDLVAEIAPLPITAARFPLGVVLRAADDAPRLELVAASGVLPRDRAEGLLASVEEELAALLAVAPVEAVALVEPVAPSSVGEDVAALEQRILTRWREVLGVPGMGPDDDFFALGGDSFSAVSTLTALDLDVPVIDVFDHPTAAALARHAASGATDSSLLRLLRGPAAGTPRYTVIVVPFGGGEAFVAQPLADAFANDVATYGVQLPGRPGVSLQTGQPAGAVAAAIADEVLKTVQGPVVVYGHCAGTAMATRLAVELDRRSAAPALLVVAAATVPDDPTDALLAEQQTSDEAWAGYLRSLGGLAGLDEASQTRLLAAGRPDHRLAMSAHQELRAAPDRLHAPALCVLGDDDPATPDLSAGWAVWRSLLPAARLAVLPGAGHYFIRTHQALLAALVDSTLKGTP